MGAHTLGHTNEQISGFRHYPWTMRFGKKILNNDYYKLIADKTVWRRLEKGGRFGVERETDGCESEDSTFLGDEHGRPWEFDWVVRSQWQNNDGGPWGWSPFARQCDPDICNTIQTLDPKSCCHYFKSNGKCDSGAVGSVRCEFDFCNKQKDKFNCTMPKFLAGAMMNVDMGLYLDFQIEEGEASGFGHGRPKGCEGLNRKSWLENWKKRPGADLPKDVSFDVNTYLQYSTKGTSGHKDIAHNKQSDMLQGKRFSGCGLNEDLTEGGDKMHEVIEQYAADNQLFVKEFSAVFHKMLENGYQEGNAKQNDPLKQHDWEWAPVRCKRKWCYFV